MYIFFHINKCIQDIWFSLEENQVSKPKHKKPRRESSRPKVEVVDNTTVQDILNNPSSILNSLDDVLDSLESFTDGKKEGVFLVNISSSLISKEEDVFK